MNNFFSFLIIFILAVIGIAYFIFVKYKVPDRKWDVLTNYVSIIISIVMGAMISILVWNHQQEQVKIKKLTLVGIKK